MWMVVAVTGVYELYEILYCGLVVQEYNDA